MGTDGQTDERMAVLFGVKVNGFINTDGRSDGRTDGWMAG